MLLLDSRSRPGVFSGVRTHDSDAVAAAAPEIGEHLDTRQIGSSDELRADRLGSDRG